MNARERCRLRAEDDGWILEIDGADRLVLPVRDGAGPYLAPTSHEAVLHAVPPNN